MKANDLRYDDDAVGADGGAYTMKKAERTAIRRGRAHASTTVRDASSNGVHGHVVTAMGDALFEAPVHLFLPSLPFFLFPLFA